MSFPDDLLEQAAHLARREKRKPKQASLRRAVSTAYYGLFHLLISEAVWQWKIETQRGSLARGFEHGKMKNACVKLPNASTNADLRFVAATFIELQQRRHDADYNNDKSWTRTEVVSLVLQADAAFKKWQAVAALPAAQDFLLSMLVDRR